ncbi:MAG TPA: hypothetical protein VIB99_02825 [Candidatus Limnocylindrales bacterium]
MTPDHAGHDETLIAGLAAADLTDPETAVARSLVASCPDCAELHADLVAIMAATAELAPPRRTRDFQLTEADAARLRPSGWRRLAAGLGRPRLALGRPLAGGLVALGIAGLIVSASPAIFGSAGSAEAGGAAAAPVSDQAGPAAGVGAASSPFDSQLSVPLAPASAAAPAAAASAAPSQASSTIPDTTPVYAGSASAQPSSVPAASGAAVAVVPAPVASDSSATKSAALAGAPGVSPSPLLIGSLVVLVAGLVVLALTWAGGRSSRR